MTTPDPPLAGDSERDPANILPEVLNQLQATRAAQHNAHSREELRDVVRAPADLEIIPGIHEPRKTGFAPGRVDSPPMSRM